MDSLKQFQDVDFGLCKILHHKEKEFTHVCLFASHTVLSFLPEYVYFYLEAVKKAGLSIVFISSSEISKPDLERLAMQADIIIEKENRGTDFGAWCSVLRWLNFGKNFQTLYLCNDSVFGPFFPLNKLHSHFLEIKEDIIGITDSFQGKEYHIQSYFVGIKNNVLKSSTWEKFWAEMSFHEDKSKVIEFYEIGLTQHLIKSGFSHTTWCNWLGNITYDFILDKVSQSETLRRYWLNRILVKKDKIISDFNPSSFLWQELINQCNNPFIKRELFIFPHLYHEYEVEQKSPEIINKHTGYPSGLIKKFLIQYNFHKAWTKTPDSRTCNISLQVPSLEDNAVENGSSNLIFQSLAVLFFKTTATHSLWQNKIQALQFTGGKVQTISLLFSEENNKEMECLLLYIDKKMVAWSKEELAKFKGLLRQIPYYIVTVADNAAGSIVSTLLQLKLENILLDKHFLTPSSNHRLLDLLRQLYAIHLLGFEAGNLYLKPSLASVIYDALHNQNSTSFFKAEDFNGQLLPEIQQPESGADREHKEFLLIKEKYAQLYEVTPWWYKKVGQIIKLFTGNKTLIVKITDKGRKERYDPTPEDITHWYFLQYEVLPKWYKKFGQSLNKPKTKNE